MNHVLMMATALCLAAAPVAAQTGNTGGTTDPNAGGQSTQGGTMGGQTGETGGQTGTTDPGAADQTGSGQYGAEQTAMPGFTGGSSREEIMRIGRERNLKVKDAAFAAVIAQRSGRSFQEVVDARTGDTDWNDLAKQYNLQWKDVKKDAKNMQRELKRAGYDEKGRTGSNMGTDRGGMGTDSDMGTRSGTGVGSGTGTGTGTGSGTGTGTGTGGTVEPGTR